MSPFHDSAAPISLTDFKAPREEEGEREREILESDPWEYHEKTVREDARDTIGREYFCT